MSSLNVTANIDFPDEKYFIGLSLVEFQEDKVTVIYSPALDLSGYGYSKEEAQNSFGESLREFFRYTKNKRTLDKVLESLGWTVKGSKKKPKFNPPKDSELVLTNSLYNEIVNNKSYSVSRQEVEFAY